jgi:VWFA-related protein
MIRACLRLGVIVAIGTASLVASQLPSFRSASNTVSLFVTVTGPGGRLVKGLDAEDFAVYDNGVRQKLTMFASDPQPVSIVIMLDRSGSMEAHHKLVSEAVSTFVGHLGRRDRARIGSFADRIAIAPESFTNDVRELRRIVREELQQGEDTPLWNATAAALDALRTESGRRVVLLFTDGKDNPGEAIGPRDYVSLPELRVRIEAEETMVYGIGLAESCGPSSNRRGRPTVFRQGGSGPRLPPSWPRPGTQMPVPPRRPPAGPIPQPPFVPGTPDESDPWCAASRPAPYVRELAEMGGGGYFELDSSARLEETFERIADELHQQYMLGFTPEAIDNTRHAIDVRVARPGHIARARRSYVAGSTTRAEQ